MKSLNFEKPRLVALLIAILWIQLLTIQPAYANHRQPDYWGAHQCNNGQYVQWKSSPSQTYEIKPGFPSGFTARIADAAAQYNSLGTTLHWSAGASVSGNSVRFFPIDGPGNTLAQTWVDYSCPTNGRGGIHEADLEFDSAEDWYTGTGDANDGVLNLCYPGCQTDAWSVATHEFGHMSGLGHYYLHDHDSVCNDDSSQHSMCRWYSGGTERQRTLEQYDKAAIREIY